MTIQDHYQIIQKTIDQLRLEQLQQIEVLNNSIDEIKNNLDKISNQVGKMEEVVIKNGNGRVIKYVRDEFFQMIYDKLQFKFLATKLSKVISVILTLLLILNLLINIFFK